jgi:hypothetical protein
MALEYLEQQMAKDKPDQKLLDRLGWSREELEQFYRQWRKMKQEAGGMGPEAQRAQGELDDALKSLGLVPRSTTLDGSGMKSDRMTRLRDSRRFDPPREWADLYKAYSEGVGSGGK